jgi:anhydro-N-acetylmuramic acid kinase
MPKVKTALGLMSGTSIDGIDIALIKSDGHQINERGIGKYYPYSQKIQNSLSKLINNKINSLLEIKQIEQEITKNHITAVLDFLTTNKIDNKEIDIIGFHGQTILHSPEQKITWQIGNAQMLASAVNIDVVADFRTKDIVCGGQGAPMVPIYHLALFKNYNKPLVVLNIGGVANITYIEDSQPENLIAFDVCFGNAPINDFVKRKIGKNFDEDGILATRGEVNKYLAQAILEIEYFKQKPPKSLDRNQFNEIINQFPYLKIENVLASLVYVIARSISGSMKFFPKQPEQIVVCGGGRKNLAIINSIRNVVGIKTNNIDDINIDGSKKIDGDFIEAEAFGFLAIRNLLDLAISYPKTTGILLEKCVPQAFGRQQSSSCGGVFYRA